MVFSLGSEDRLYFSQFLKVEDEDLPVAEIALKIAHMAMPDISIDRYENHLKRLPKDLAEAYAGQEDTLENRLKTLHQVFTNKYEYRGDTETYDDLQNANLIRVIERRKGLPVALSILCVHACRAVGWDVDIIGLPGHVMCRMNFEGAQQLFDPFDQCKVVEAKDLRLLIKNALGADAELKPEHIQVMEGRDALVRLQNNLKFRQIEHSDYEAALQTIEIMRMLVPDEYRLLLESGVLYSRIGQGLAAVRHLEIYLEKAPEGRDADEARYLLRQVKSTLQ